MKSSLRILFLLAGAFLIGLAAGGRFGTAESLAQGYDGLIADDKSSSSSDEGPGYEGLIPGKVPAPESEPEQTQQSQTAIDQMEEQHARGPALYGDDDGQEQHRHNAAKKQGRARSYVTATGAPMSLAPNYKPKRVETIDDIKTVAMMDLPKELDWNMLPPGMEKTLSNMLTPEQRESLNAPRPRVNGMLPAEERTKEKVDEIMYFVNRKDISEEDRRANVRKAEQKLKGLANAYKLRAAVPDGIYQKMGVPEIYMKEDREGARKALERIDAALKEVGKYDSK